MFTDLLKRLNKLFGQIIYQLEGVIFKSGTDYNQYNSDEKNIIRISVSLAKAVKTVIDTPILTKEGNIDDKAITVLNENQKLLNHMGA